MAGISENNDRGWKSSFLQTKLFRRGAKLRSTTVKFSGYSLSLMGTIFRFTSMAELKGFYLFQITIQLMSDSSMPYGGKDEMASDACNLATILFICNFLSRLD